jgi:predicted GNAT superfamily acetyltransferase
MQPIVIRPLEARDLSVLHRMNQAAVTGVGSVTREEFTRLVFDLADVVLVATGDDGPLGFVLCMVEGVDYGSLNYQWISRRYVSFAYVDRIAVAETARGLGIGQRLYEKAFRNYGGSRPVLMAEVNLEPPNPGLARDNQSETPATIRMRRFARVS